MKGKAAHKKPAHHKKEMPAMAHEHKKEHAKKATAHHKKKHKHED
jgi:hypothetical protein